MTITCHCIIAHPNKPKFLVIRHTDRWSPPVLQVPAEGSLMYKPATINQGMMKKYGLRTTVLRIILEGKNYAVIELEMHATSRRKMQAVWVGHEEYVRFRNRETGDEDPLEDWLQQAASGHVPELRAPWERPGWYREAERWMTDKLVGQGIQASGSVQQFKAGWPTACLLRVATLEGRIYLKATYAKPPGEARLTDTLAAHWPDLVPRPLAVEEDRNWMLMRDFKIGKENRPSAADYPLFARALGAFQVDAMDHMDRWRELKCPVMDLPFLRNEDGRAEELFAKVGEFLKSGFNALNDDEMARLQNAIGEARQASAELGEYSIPDSLVHLDFRPDNFFLEDGKCRVIDWADVVITHPFIALSRTLDFLERLGTWETPLRTHSEPIDQALLVSMRKEYLSSFAGSLPMENLERALASARAVFPLFWLYYTASQIQIIEAQTPQGDRLRNILKVNARNLLVAAGA